MGDTTTIALKLISITPGLRVADTGGQDLFTSGDTHILGTGDYFEFKPVFYVSESAPEQVYSATFQLVDVTSDASHTHFGDSGLFTLNFQPSSAAIPEPFSILGAITSVSFGAAFKHKLNRR